MSGGVGVSGVYWEAGRDSRYSGARRGIGGIMGHLGFLGGVGAIRGVRGCHGV